MLIQEMTPQRRLDEILHHAAALGISDLVFAAMHYGANINSYCSQKMTALHKAAQEGHIEVCKILLVNGADKTLQTGNGSKTASTLAYEQRRHDLMKMIEDFDYYIFLEEIEDES